MPHPGTMSAMPIQPEITQRDLRSRSKEIMDAVEHGQSFTVTRDGHRIGELIPLRRRRRFVPRQEFAAMSRNAPSVDTNIVILRRRIDPTELPDEMAISAITLAALSAGPHEVRGNGEQSAYDEHAERARRLEILQRVENEFDPIPFGAEAARIYGRVAAAVIGAGRKPRGRFADLMIAATALAEGCRCSRRIPRTSSVSTRS